MRRRRRARPRLRPPTPDGRGSSFVAQGVPDAANGLDEPRLVGRFGLAPQVADVDVERVRGEAEVVAPDPLEDHRARQDLARVPQEELEQGELRSRELDLPRGSADLACAGVELEVGESENLAGLVARPPQ